MRNTIVLISCAVLTSSVLASPLVLTPQHVIKSNKVAPKVTRTYTYQVGGTNVVSASEVNVINFKTAFSALNEPSNQGIAGTSNSQSINNNHSFMFTAAGKRHIQFVFSMKNGHAPVILQFDVRNVGARAINIPTSLSGVAPLKTIFKKHRGFEGKVLTLTRDALNGTLGAAWVTDTKDYQCPIDDSKTGITGRFSDIKARYICAQTHQAFTSKQVGVYHNNDFALLELSVCSSARNTLTLKDAWFHLSKDDVAITITRHQLSKGACAKVVLIRSVTNAQEEKPGMLASPIETGEQGNA